MKAITLYIPDSSNIEATEIAMILAAHLYEKGKLSLGQGAEVAGLSTRTFAELLGNYGVSIFNYPAIDLIKDVNNA